MAVHDEKKTPVPPMYLRLKLLKMKTNREASVEFDANRWRNGVGSERYGGEDAVPPTGSPENHKTKK